MDHSTFDSWKGRVLDGRYKVETVVGVGGMAYVLKAKDLRMGRDVAVKMLGDEFRNDERAVKRFINESKTVSMLDHPNIVKIFDVVISEEYKYIVMEFIDGITLKDYIDSVGTLSWKEAVYYTEQVLAALNHAHKRNVIHRDIKPQNIMLLSDGRVKVTDFGIAKQPNAESVTVTDKAIGTVNYISPEQASGKTVDFRSDIYSTGVMLYEMVTGKLPFVADSPVTVAMMQVQSIPERPRSVNAAVPLGLEQIILKAMNKKPDDRFISAHAMGRALEYFSGNPDTVFSGDGVENGDPNTEKQRIKEDKRRAKQQRLEKKRYRGSRAMFPIIAGVAASFLLVSVLFVALYVMPMLRESADPNADGAMEMLESGFSPVVDKLLGVDVVSSGERNIEIVSYVGEVYNDALVERMHSEGFTVREVKKVRNVKYGAGTVTRQEPEGSEIRLRPADGSPLPITLYVNLGEESMKMPDCTLLSVNEAKKLIRTQIGARMLTEFRESSIRTVEEFHDSYPDGYVIRTEPAYGDPVALDGSLTVTLYVSKGQEAMTSVVPTLVGKTKDEARRALANAGLSIRQISYESSDDYAAGLVISASMSAGDTATQKVTSVDLCISTGAAEPEPDTVTVNATPEEPDTTNTPSAHDEPITAPDEEPVTEQTEKPVETEETPEETETDEPAPEEPTEN